MSNLVMIPAWFVVMAYALHRAKTSLYKVDVSGWAFISGACFANGLLRLFGVIQ